MSDEQIRSARYWNVGRFSVAVVLIGLVVGISWYGLAHQGGGHGRNITGFGTSRAMAGPDGRSGAASVAASGAASGGAFNFDDLQIDRELIHRGGPAKDGIPSLTDPKFIAASEASYLQGDDRVVSLEIAGEARAYPVAILNYHECVNDTIGDQALAIIYCPLCDSFSVVDRKFEGKTLEFGISGLLANSNVLLYDRTDQALWSQVRLTAISGPHAGQTLRYLDRWQIETFAEFKKRHPDGQVLSNMTGHRRNYTRSPYVNYFKNQQLMFPVEFTDDRMKPKTPVIGVRYEDGRTVAYPIHLINGELQEGDLVIGHNPKTNRIELISLPEGAAVVHTFWFAWYAYHPKTQVYDGE